ncbi:MAG TPA: type II secretion system F family protein [Mycobacteriales bacterium]|nr:type II secretion system F family protein [Mycobacteriales bacterium]
MLSRRNRARLDVVVARPAASVPQPRMALRWTLAIATALAGWFGIGGVLGIGLGLGAAAGIIVTAGLAVHPPTAEPDAVPVVVELLAGCLDAGLTMPDSLDAASVAGDAVTADACRVAAAALRRGAPAAEAWQTWTSDPWLQPVARATARVTESGASVADELRRVANRLRSRRHARLKQRVEQASVWVVIPLGLFFLPAFVLVAVVPVVIGLFSGLKS